eukprot:3695816-Amphidinium_carterae.1
MASLLVAATRPLVAIALGHELLTSEGFMSRAHDALEVVREAFASVQYQRLEVSRDHEAVRQGLAMSCEQEETLRRLRSRTSALNKDEFDLREFVQDHLYPPLFGDPELGGQASFDVWLWLCLKHTRRAKKPTMLHDVWSLCQMWWSALSEKHGSFCMFSLPPTSHQKNGCVCEIHPVKHTICRSKSSTPSASRPC